MTRDKLLDGKNSNTNTGSNSGVMAGLINRVHINLPKENNRILSYIGAFVKMLATMDEELDEDIYTEKLLAKWQTKEYSFEDKINFNSIKRYRLIIEEFSKYSVYCDDIFNKTDNTLIGSKRKILKNIHRIYLHFLGEIVGETNDKQLILKLIKSNSDEIIDKVKAKLRDDLINEFKEGEIFREDMEEALEIIICYAFMECRILEKPGGKYDIKS